MKPKSLTLLMCSLLGTSSVSAAPISFQQAWDILQHSNHSLAAERANVEHYQYMQDSTFNLNLPSVTISANYMRLDQDVTLSLKQIAESSGTNLAALTQTPLGSLTSTMTERDIFSSSIRAVWPIFTGGRITAAQTAAEGKKEEAQSQLAMVTQARYEDLAKYYYSVVLAKEVLNTRIAVEQGLTQHRNNALKLEQQGQIALVERLQAEASLDKATIERKKAEKDLDIAQSALTQILSQDQSVEPSGQLFINQSLPPLSAFVEQTLSTYPGLDLLSAKEKQANSLIKAEKGKYYPEVYAFGNYSLYDDDSLVSQMKPDWMVGVGVSIPLIENTGRSHQVKAANSTVSQVRFLRAQAKQDLTVLVEKTYKEAEQALEEVQGLDSSLTLAQENLLLRQKAFNQGLATSLDVVDAELYLASIRTQQAVAGFNYLISLSKLLALSSEMNTFSQYKQMAIPLTMHFTQDLTSQKEPS
ncbi:outer membrane protein [Vibrio cincinnatiensis]|uniref:Outer membrane protein TolC n=1 Tax=Vibrio cincinnatiensis DSM 19608 TaxID=1123491 RepID=A0A1T4KVD8_VIBCI|nr:TolC family protein [Vibrio cincinnatiensis]SJZ46328.1 Outer membrane protein TolC [Vibrio cincinnatiensis DSM 19608]SUP48371.1 outer membrane protein [Vibrio cincinnatiensis]